MSIFRKKSLVRILEENKNKVFKPTMKTLDLVLFGIAAIVGSGVMVLTGVASASAGPAVIFSFLLAGLACTIVALCYAEMASAVPSSGSTYTYMYVALGEIIAYVVAWVLLGGYILTAAAVSNGWSNYFNSFLSSIGISLPEKFTSIPSEGGIGNIPAVIVILLLTIILTRGTSESKALNNILAVIKIGIVLLFISVGSYYINIENWTNNFAPTGVGGVMLGATTVFFAYLGLDAISTAAEEVINPQKTLPKAILITMLVCTIMYILVCLVLTGVVPYDTLGKGNALVYVLNQVGQTKVASLISLGATLGLTAGVLSFIYAAVRIAFTMARDGLLPKTLAKVNKNQVPNSLTWLVGLLTAVFAGFLPLGQLSEIANVASMIAFMLVAYATLKFRKTHPEVNRGFKVPAMPLIPILAIIIFGILLTTSVTATTWMITLVWLLIGLSIYFTYSIKNSKEK
ncbi:amino acid permease [Gemella sp. 19428wG2_WT2a]|nr:amino acid permease [Gemella sp. 19428wG2_WT2a]TFU59932.1 amino acid permease [Gemella sp. WT2a]